MRIGDLILPAESVSGDGFSSYLAAGQLRPDCFLAPARPDPELLSRLRQIAAPLCVESDAALLEGRVFSSDSIVAQFHHLDEMVNSHGCIGIEMETAAVFRAARLVGIPAAALLQISDVAPDSKSLFSGRTEAEQQRRQQLRRELVSRIVIEALVGPATTPSRFGAAQSQW
jgi:purine-nucleoside phosphorylase